ncbi:hypothetical protein Tco_0619178, partial [Tanacetum coccineum]
MDCGEINAIVEEEEENWMSPDSRISTHLYSNPNTDPDRMPLTKAKGQVSQKDKIH